MNIIDGFVIGMRFRLDGDEEPDREAIYETVFRTVPVSVSVPISTGTLATIFF